MVQHGGKDAEDGSEFRARVGALLSTSVLLGDPLTATGCPVGGIPESIAAETDDPVDDLVVRQVGGGRVLLQAKQTVTLNTAPKAPLVKALMQFARAARESPSDRLVLVTSSLSRTLRECDEHLAAAGRAQPPSMKPRVHDAFDKMRSVLKANGLEEHEADDAFRRMRFWEVDPRSGTGYGLTATRMAQAGFLDGERAADVVTDLVRTLARERAGEGAEGLVAALRANGIPVQPLPAVSGPVAEVALLADYRDRLVRRGRTLEILGVPRAMADLPFDDADADVRVIVPPSDDDESDQRDRHRDVVVAVRRRGRVVMVGTGGSGKSTAVRRLCARWAADPHGPVPLPVSCVDLRDRLDDLPQALTELAARQLLDDSQRTALAAALRRKLARGEVFIALDGLDEITRGREHFARTVSAWLDEVPGDCEVVLTARPSAGTALDHFPWPRLQLLRPEKADELGKAVIDAVASTVQQRSARRHWFSERLQRDRALGETPLTVMLLAVLAARVKELDALPTSRAQVLKKTLTDLIEHWEVGNRRRGDLAIGQLTGERAEIAVRLVLWRLARRTLEPELGGPVVPDLAEVLRHALDLKLREAEAAAEAAQSFWFETGLFATDEDAAVVTAPLRPIAEAAAAWQFTEEGKSPAFGSDSEPRTPVAVLSLAAGLSSEVLDQWVAWVMREGQADDLIDLVDAHRDGACLDGEQIRLLIREALPRWLDDPRDVERMFEACWQLRLTDDDQGAARNAFLAVEPFGGRQQLVRDAVRLRWPLNSDETSEVADRVLEMPEPPPLDEAPPAGVIWFPMRDQLYDETVQKAALALVDRSRADAETITERFEERGTIGFRRELEKRLRSAGHPDLAKAIASPKSLRRSIALFKDLGDMDAAEDRLLAIMKGLGTPARLTVRQRRRYDEIADLYKTVAGDYAWPSWALKHTDACRLLYEIVADLGGFDRTVIAAQAQALEHELRRDRDSWYLLGDGSRRRPVDRWDRRPDSKETVKDLVSLWPQVPMGVHPIISSALLATPEQDLALHELKALLPRLRKTQTIVAEMCLAFAGASWRSLADEWWTSADPQIRQAISWTAAQLWQTDEPPARQIVQALLNDPDVHVRAEAVDSLGSASNASELHIDASLATVLRRARDNPVGETECRNCLETVPPDATSCPSCSVVIPSPRARMSELLGEAPQEPRRHARPRPSRRRVSPTSSLLDEDH